MAKNLLDWDGLVYFWNNKVKPLIKKQATVNEDIVVNNPRVGKEIEGHVFAKGETLNEVLTYLFSQEIAEVQPSTAYTLPTITIKTGGISSAELNSVINYTVSVDTFDSGLIGTCIEPFHKEPKQSTVDSGSTRYSNTLKLYTGTSTDPSKCINDVSSGIVNDVYTGSLTLSTAGNISTDYFTGTVNYSKSTAESKTSYGNPANVTGVSSFPQGITVKCPCVNFNILSYKPSFGNISFTETATPPSATITNLGNIFNKEGEDVFYCGPVSTVGGKSDTFMIYFPAEFTAQVQYYDTTSLSWAIVQTKVSSGYKASLPAGSTVSKFPSKSILIGEDYKLITLADEIATGERKYKLILTL